VEQQGKTLTIFFKGATVRSENIVQQNKVRHSMDKIWRLISTFNAKRREAARKRIAAKAERINQLRIARDPYQDPANFGI
jgi:hypothetical protein